ncbi:BMP family lipoprotein [Streptomyces sp. NBC_01716]|uniref:BMP family lipoprotein n=1 Tax=Streptomyces sp. NBC_01716 TaxID=2975917 RepID=UPI002E380DBD|nr:BMP family ABC transporter substrate-binding protein [Streptomyces sp. NBC_01716]
MRNKIVLAVVVAAIPVVLTACGGSSSGNAGGSAGSGKKTIGFLAQAPRNDGGFTQFSLAGVNAAIAKNADLRLSSVVDNAGNSQEQIQGLESLAAKNDIVIADGASLNKPVAVVAPKYPKVRFILVASDLDKYAGNVTSVTTAVGHNAIVAGAVASMHSHSKKLGMIAGLQVPASTAWYHGMVQGARIDNPATKVVQTYTGDYNDVGKAKQAAEAMMANGVDQILSDLDSGSEGVYQAADAGKPAASVYDVFATHCDSSPNIIGSGVVSWADILQSAVTDAATDKLPSGAISYGLASGALRFEFCPGKGSAAEKALAQKVTKQIVDGGITADKGVLLPKPSYKFEQR